MPDTSFPLIFGVLALICGSANLSAGTIYQTTFQRNAWRQEDWIMVKSPRWESFHQWVQHKDHIANPIPEYAAEDQLVPGHQSYTSVVLNQAIDTTRGARIRSTMSFDYDQAPQIVIASALGQAEEGIAEYRDHYELVLFARGLNIWHHTYQDGQPYWRLVAYMPFSTESGRPYEMQMTVSNTRGKQPSERAGSGRLLTIEVAGHSFSYFAPGLPDSLYFGLIGYASTNRFYDFIVETLK